MMRVDTFMRMNESTYAYLHEFETRHSVSYNQPRRQLIQIDPTYDEYGKDDCEFEC
jgi:hypothetical protein